MNLIQAQLALAMCVICAFTGRLTADEPNAKRSDKWLDKYLSEEMEYDEQQIKQFKDNVADMSEEDLRRMLRRIKHHRAFRDAQREMTLAVQESNYNRLQAARALAYAHPTHSTYYKFNRRIRTIGRNPGGQSLFRGYWVGIFTR